MSNQFTFLSLPFISETPIPKAKRIGGHKTPQQAREMFPKLALGFIPMIKLYQS
jgi:hypothetical protein